MTHLKMADKVEIPSNLEDAILALKKERNAVILAHYYQDSEIQDIADFIGDSLQLSQEAAKTNADVICFAGVVFMAETAKILNSTKTVVVPDLNAGCSLVNGCPADKFAAWQKLYPDAITVSYINCSAEVKALSDYICTSSNAEKIVRSIPDDKTILFAPDKNLGNWIQKKLDRPMIMWQGSCIVHESFSEKKLVALKERYPDALVLAHPECEEPILKLADFIGSTSALLNFAVKTESKQFIIATEVGIIHQMQKAVPHKIFIPAPPEANCACNECPFMKLNSMEKVYLSLLNLEPKIELGQDLMEKARVPIDRMMELSK
jgi:quinolinate synthase